MADAPPLPDQPLPDWMSYSLVVDPDGSEEYTIVTLPLTYYGPSIPLGPDWTYGGLTSPAATPTDVGGEPTEAPAPAPAPTEAPAPNDEPVTVTAEPEPATVFVTVTPDPLTIVVTQVVTPPPATTVFVTIPNPSTNPLPVPSVTGQGISQSIGSLTQTSSPTLSNSAPLSSISSTPTTSRPATALPLSNGNTSAGQPPPSSTSPTDTTSDQAPIPESALPSVTGSARTYLGLAPNAFLGLIIAIVLSLIILLCCVICFLRHRRRERKKELEAFPTPTADQGSRLLAGDRDPTREDLAYPYAEPGREYRRSQIAIMRARGELDDDWEDRVHSPSMRTASLRLPEDEIGTAYGIRERAFAAAGVRPPYGYTPVPRESPSIGSGMRSIGSTGNSTNVATITPATAGMGAMAAAGAVAADSEARASPTPKKKDTQSTQATDSSALHMYAAGGRSRMDSSEGADQFFYHQTSEEEGPSPVASSSDLHFLQRYSTQGVVGAAAAAGAAAGAVAARRRTGDSGSTQNSSGSGGQRSDNRTRNLEEVPRAAIAYPESPVSDDHEDSHLMPEGEPPVMVLGDAPSRSQSRSTRESGLSRWIHDRNGGSNRASQQQQPILQRVFNRVMGNRLSTQPTFAIIPPSPARPQPPPSSYDQPYRDDPSRHSNGDFDVGGGLRFPRPPVHTGYSSAASTARDDMRVWGGILPSRWSFGASSRTPRGSADVDSRGNAGAPAENTALMSQMEEGTSSGSRFLAVPITTSRDTLPQMRERAPTPAGMPLSGFGLRPPPPSAFPPERRSSGVSSGRSTVYYDARSTTSTPMQSLGSNHDRAGSPLSRYDSPPPQPITALRSAQSAQSFQSANTAPFLPPGLYAPPQEHDDTDDEHIDILDDPPPMPTHDIRQARSLNTIFSVGTAETYDTANPPLSIGRAFSHDEQIRFPPPGIEPAPRIGRSVPSDITPSEAADADLGAGYSSLGQSSSGWRSARGVGEHGEIDVLEEEPPMAASQWRVLSAYPQSDTGSGRGSVRTGQSLRDLAQRSDWRLTLGQPVVLANPQDEPIRYSQFGDLGSQHDYLSQPGSQNSRGSSNQTNVSHSRDIHSLRASEIGTGGSNGSRETARTGTSHRSVSEQGHLRTAGTISGVEGGALLSAFGPGPGRSGRAGVSEGNARAPVEPPLQEASTSRVGESSQQPLRTPARTNTPPSAPANFPSTPGVRLVGSASTAGTSGQGPSSAPVLPSRGWPSQAVPTDVTAEDGRRPSGSHSFLFRESPLFSHSHSPSGDTYESSRPGTSTSHSHTHGTHGAETTMGTMTEATTEDHHYGMPDMPLSDVEHILRHGSPRGPEIKVEEEEGKQQILEGRGTPPVPGQWQEMPRWL